MKQILKLSLLLLALLLPATASADSFDFEYDGIAYNILGSSTVEVTAYYYFDYAYYENVYRPYSGDIVIPETVNYNNKTYTVTTISDCFYDCPELTSVSIPATITSIEYVFSNCPNLTGLTVASGNTKYDSRDNCNAIIETATNELIKGCKNTSIPNSVTSIGESAFSNCSGLTSIDIPNSVTSIGGWAFYNCSGLTSVNIGNSVMTIGQSAFYDCSGLTSIDIPNSVTSINEAVFEGCSGLTSANIGNAVTSIGQNAFNGCRELTSVNIPNSVSRIDRRAFYGCSGLCRVDISDLESWCEINLQDSCANPLLYAHHLYLDGREITNLVIPSSITKIKDYTFSGYTGSLTIPSTVTDISTYAFYHSVLTNSITVESGNTVYDSRDNCNAIIKTASNALIAGCENTVIPNTVTSIGQFAFYGNTRITTVTIHEYITSIGKEAFAGCTSLETLNFNAISCSGFIYEYETWYYPDPYSTFEFTYFTSYNPFSNTNISTINIGNQVKIIPSNFGLGFKKLKSVTIPESVESIGYCAFQNCPLLDTLIFNANACSDFKYSDYLNYDPDYPDFFEQVVKPFLNANLSSIQIGDYVQNIPAYLAYGSTKLTSLTIPNSVTSIGKSAFEGCTGLTRVNINDVSSWCKIQFGNLSANPLYNAHYLYLNGTRLTNLAIPNNVNAIGANAFAGGYGLTNVSIHDRVTSIGNSAFYNCTGLTTINIPCSISSIGDYAFQGCTALDTLNYNAVSCADFNSTASYRPFYNLNISSINVGDSVQRIPAYFAFGLNSLKNVAIGKSVNSLGKQAFNNSVAIEKVSCNSTIPPAWAEVPAMFSSTVYNNAPLYVPMNSESAYSAHQGWGLFANIIGKGVFATGISLNHSHENMIVGGSLQLTATVLPDSASVKQVVWASSDPSVASVDENGLVTAHAVGGATITATTTDGTDLSASCGVTVNEDLSNYDNYLLPNDATAFHGSTIVIPVKMTNAVSIISFQTDIFLPEGLELLKEDGEYMIDPSERMTRTHSIMSNDVSNGAVRVICYSSNYKPFTGNSGDDLFYITVKVADDAEGDYTIVLRNTLLTNTSFVDLTAPDVASNVNVAAYVLGDANNSGMVTITDVVVTAQYVLEMNPNPFVFRAADVNFDGAITVADVSRIAWMVLNPDEANAPLRAPALWNNGDRMSGEGVSLMAGETRTVSIALDNEMDYTAFQMDLTLPEGLTASNFRLTDRAGSHAFDINTLANGKTRVLCYSPAIEVIDGHDGALLTFDVTATAAIEGCITIDGIELVTADCQTVHPDAFTIGVNAATSINEIAGSKTVARVDYFNVAGQRIDRPDSGVILVVTTYSDGTRSTTKLMK